MEEKLNSAVPKGEKGRIKEVEAPPFFKNWTRWYIGLMIYLTTLIALFYFFTKAFE